MLLSITTTHRPATDLGYLLGKHPDRLQTFELAYGNAHVFYPVANADECTACLLLDIDPIGLVRNHRGGPDDATLARYVNDRPYVASSFMSVAIARVFASALGGVAKEHADLAATAMPLMSLAYMYSVVLVMPPGSLRSTATLVRHTCGNLKSGSVTFNV